MHPFVPHHPVALSLISKSATCPKLYLLLLLAAAARRGHNQAQSPIATVEMLAAIPAISPLVKPLFAEFTEFVSVAVLAVGCAIRDAADVDVAREVKRFSSVLVMKASVGFGRSR